MAQFQNGHGNHDLGGIRRSLYLLANVGKAVETPIDKPHPALIKGWTQGQLVSGLAAVQPIGYQYSR